MKKVRIAAALALAACLGACNLSAVSSPGQVAASTTLDEKALAGVELAYQAATTAELTAVRAGLVDDNAKARLKVLDGTAYAALVTARSAYAAGNAADYGSAVTTAMQAVAAFAAATK